MTEWFDPFKYMTVKDFGAYVRGLMRIAAIAPNFGREGLHIMTASMRLVHEGCKSGHFTVGGADIDLRKALAIARHGAPGVLSSPTPEHHEPVRA